MRDTYQGFLLNSSRKNMDNLNLNSFLMKDTRPADGVSLRQTHCTNESREVEQPRQSAGWWITSTGIPLLAGTFGPIANAFNLCSLVGVWIVKMPSDKGILSNEETDVSDPSWFVPPPMTPSKIMRKHSAHNIRELAVNILSLVCAVVSNLSLLMYLARRLSFTIAQPVVIIGWYISSASLAILLILVYYRLYLPGKMHYKLTQSYYYGAIAAVLYFILSSSLILTNLGTHKGHYSQKYGLTKAQRTLMLQTVSFLVYLLAGSAVYARVENWTFTDAVYWSDSTLLTIGIGQPAPRTHLGRGLFFPYAIGGILLLGIVIGSIRSLMIERGKEKMSGHLIEKTRKKIAKLIAKGRPFPMLFPCHAPRSEDYERQRLRHEFHATRKPRKVMAAQHRWFSLFGSVIAIMMVWFLGAAVFWKSESIQNWTYFEALYFSYTTLLTIGYGDFYPVTDWGKSFFVLWSLLAVPTMTIFISNLVDTVVDKVRNLTVLLGELTILPGEGSTRDKFRRLFRKPSNSGADDKEMSPQESQQHEPKPNEEDRVEWVGGVMEDDTLRGEQLSHERGDVAAKNTPRYEYLLIHELRKMIKYIKSDPPKRFSYDEWAYYLRLLEEEPVSSFPPSSPPNGGPAGERKADDVNRHEDQRRWSWIGVRSPLVGDRAEAEWLLDALSDKLEIELRKLRDH